MAIPPTPPDFNPFWMGPQFVPAVEITKILANWDQAAQYLAQVLPRLIVPLYKAYEADGLPPLLIRDLLVNYQDMWLDEFFSQGEMSADPDWPLYEEDDDEAS